MLLSLLVTLMIVLALLLLLYVAIVILGIVVYAAGYIVVCESVGVAVVIGIFVVYVRCVRVVGDVVVVTDSDAVPATIYV